MLPARTFQQACLFSTTGLAQEPTAGNPGHRMGRLPWDQVHSSGWGVVSMKSETGDTHTHTHTPEAGPSHGVDLVYC